MSFNFQKNGFIKPQTLNKPVIPAVDPIERILEQKKIRKTNSEPTLESTPLKTTDLQQRLATLKELRK